MSGTSHQSCYVGVDVGTGSARALLLRADGTALASSTQAIQTWRDPTDHRIFEQSTTNIWDSISTAIKTVLTIGKVSKRAVKGIGFDATCSLAVVDWNGLPRIVTSGEDLGTVGDRNVILWADHRAEEEADLINGTGSVVLDYVGGAMSLEMEIPKILWLKKHMPSSLFPACQFFDLPDYLTYRATGSPSRSCCSLTCKCSFIPEVGWKDEFFKAIGLEQLGENGYNQIGGGEVPVQTAGMPVGNGLTKTAAEELGLAEGTPVGSALIDAYAGWMGTVAASCEQDGPHSGPIAASLDDSAHRIAVIAGTSTCHLIQSPKSVFVNGVWGPYKDAVFQGWWMTEGGQSSTGQLIDFILETHPAYAELTVLAKQRQAVVHEVLHDLLEDLRKDNGVESLTELTKDIHFYPDLHGNRSPLADSRMRGSIVGLSLDSSLSDLAKKYNVVLESIALQTRQILEALNEAGHTVNAIYISGGQARAAPLMRLLADVCSLPVVIPIDAQAAVVRGAAILGRFAAEATGQGTKCGEEAGELLWKIMIEMTPPASPVLPAASARERRLLDAKYKIFRESIEIQQRWRSEMNAAAAYRVLVVGEIPPPSQ